ncbi:MAG: beta-ketoacyl-ACP synthase III [Elusimicrobiota bacterium]|nr:beta-ketoacyl-ACP synthase III [Elusimicrobiota bacterium]
MKTYGIKILSTGSYLPEKVLTNYDLEKLVDTSDEWITTRTGIKERRIASSDVACSDLSVEASKKAIEDAGISAEEIDLIIVATITPDMLFPSTACLVEKKLNIKNRCAFDISAACSGFVYGLGCAKALLEAGSYSTCLLIGAEVLSKITNWKDRSTCILFGDGAGAMILKRVERAAEDQSDILSVYLSSDGNYGDLLKLPAGGSLQPASFQTVQQNLHYIQMEGREVFKLAVMKMLEAAKKALEMCNLKFEDLALLIPHQANIRIIDAIAERVNLPREKIFVNLDKYGNISSATTIIALDEARKSGIVKPGDLVELVAFGGGLTWAAAVIRV